jgi:8-oxo-dGTP pyrophosphatase MutT (NUDIX family)
LTDDERFSLAAYVVLTNEGDQVLITRRRDGGEWVLPGGSVEQGEAPWEAVAREVREETGVEITDVRLTGLYAKRSERDVVLVFRAGLAGGTPRSSEERDRVVFVEPDRLPPETSPRDRDRIGDALSTHGEPVLVVQPSSADEPPPGTR